MSERRLTDDGFVRAPTRSRWRRRLIAVAIYAALLAASSMVRARQPVPAPEPGARQIVVTPGTPFVPVPGTPALPPVAMAYTQRCGTDARLNVHPERWHVSRDGDGPAPLQHPPIILLHGSPGARHDFDGLLDALARDRCVIAPDLPGFGDTVGDVPDYGVPPTPPMSRRCWTLSTSRTPTWSVSAWAAASPSRFPGWRPPASAR